MSGRSSASRGCRGRRRGDSSQPRRNPNPTRKTNPKPNPPPPNPNPTVTRWQEVKDRGRAQRAPPRTPDAFADALRIGVELGELQVPQKEDVALISRIYRDAFTTAMQAVTELQNPFLGWGDVAGIALCEGLAHAHEHGGLQKLKRLDLKGNRLGDATVNHLVNLAHQYGLANLECLSLGSNAISDQGMRSLASAVARGSLPSCTSIELAGNPGSAAPVQEALTQRQKSANASPDPARPPRAAEQARAGTSPTISPLRQKANALFGRKPKSS